jgi:hypothetical protein
MVRFIDQHRETYGVEPICALLPIAPSTYFLWKARRWWAWAHFATLKDPTRIILRKMVEEQPGPSTAVKHLGSMPISTLIAECPCRSRR